MNYKIIQDENKFNEFINWLPELEKGEAFYFSLFARKKYCQNNEIKLDKCQIKRGLATNKEWLYDKIKQLEVEVGSYKSHGVAIPQEALALYITINPRSLIKATKNSLIKFANLITKEYDGYNPQAIVMSEIQTAGSRRIYMDLDFDNISINDVLSKIDATKLNQDCLTFVETRGGCHLLIKLDDIKPEFKKSWYQHLTSIEGCDMRGTDSLLNVVGCCQGGFTPKLIYLAFFQQSPF